MAKLTYHAHFCKSLAAKRHAKNVLRGKLQFLIYDKTCLHETFSNNLMRILIVNVQSVDTFIQLTLQF